MPTLPSCGRRSLALLLLCVCCAMPIAAQNNAPAMYTNRLTPLRAKVPEFIEQLADPDASVRRDAAEALGQVPDERAIGPLIATLGDDDQSVRSAAARALLPQDDVWTVGPLFQRMREEIAKGYGYGLLTKLPQIRDPLALSVLLQESSSSDADSRFVAAQMLGHIHQPEAADRLAAMLAEETDPAVRLQVLFALAALRDARAIPGLEQVLAEDDSAEKARVATLLGGIHDRAATPALLPLLADPNERVRTEAIRAVQELADPVAVAPLLARVPEASPTERLLLFNALVSIDLPAIPALSDAAVHAKTIGERIFAIRALTAINSPQAAPAFLEALNDADVRVRYWAIWGLGSTKESRAVPALLALAQSVPTTEEAAEVWRQHTPVTNYAPYFHLIGNKDFPERPPLDGLSLKIAATMALGEIADARAADVLVSLFTDENPYVKDAAGQALQQANLPGTVRRLLPVLAAGDDQLNVRILGMVRAHPDRSLYADVLPLLQDQNAVVRRYAVEILAQLGDERACDEIIRMVNDPDEVVRGTAVACLGNFTSDKALACLSRIVSVGEGQLRLFAAMAFHAQPAPDPRAIPTLAAIVENRGDQNAYEYAVGALGKSTNPAATRVLVNAAKTATSLNDPWARPLVYKALAGHAGPQVVIAFATGCRDSNIWIREACVEGLATTADPRGADALLAALTDPCLSIPPKAVVGLGRMRAGKAVEPLLAMLQDDSSWGWREAAATAFSMMPEPRAYPVLVRLARRQSPACISALAAYDSEQTRRELQEIAQGDSTDGRLAALRVLAAKKDSEAPRLLRLALQESNLFLKGESAVLLAKLGATDVRPQLEQVVRRCEAMLGPQVSNQQVAELLASARPALERLAQ